MNSTFRLQNLENGEEAVCSLVFPADADSSRGTISVLALIGTAVLGYRVGLNAIMGYIQQSRAEKPWLRCARCRRGTQTSFAVLYGANLLCLTSDGDLRCRAAVHEPHFADEA
jgi:hypothetical protein